MNRKIGLSICLIIPIALLFFLSCSTTDTVAPIEKTEVVPSEIVVSEERVQYEDVILHIVETSDVQGDIFPYDFVNNIEKESSLMKVSSYVKELRETGVPLVLLDNGNTLQGEPLVDYYSFVEKKKPHIVPLVYNSMGYDAAAVAAEDVQVGADVALQVIEEADYPYLSANIVDRQTLEPILSPYTVIERGDIHIAVLALSSPSFFTPYSEGILFVDEIEAAKRWVDHIRQVEHVDAVIGLFYSDNGVSVAESVDGFDLIFTRGELLGETREIIAPSGKKVPIIGALPSAKSVAHGTLTFSYDSLTESYQVVQVEVENVLVEEREDDPLLLSQFSEYIDGMIEWVFTKIGEIKESVSTRESIFGDSKFVDLLHTLQLKQTSAQLSMSAPLSTDTTIEKGEVYIQDILSLYSENTYLCVVELSGEQLYQIMENSYGNWFNQMASIQDDLIKFKTDSNGNLIFNERYQRYEEETSSTNYLSLENVNYIVDITKEEGKRVTLRTLSDNTPFDLDATYTVVLDSRFVFGKDSVLEILGLNVEQINEMLVQVTSIPFSYYLIEEFFAQKYVEPTVDNNWVVIPNIWVQRGIKNSYPKLYGEQL